VIEVVVESRILRILPELNAGEAGKAQRRAVALRANLKTEHYVKGRSADGMLYRFFKLLAYPACMDEHRITSRHRVLKAGTIEFGGGAIDCTVRNLSGTGAALNVTTPVGIPDHFTLVLSADGSHQACRVVWRKEKRIGVAFEA
jgi:hypothetical protein